MKGYRTLIISVLVVVVGALQGMNWLDLLPDNSEAAGWIITGLGCIMLILRSITTTPITKAN